MKIHGYICFFLLLVASIQLHAQVKGVVRDTDGEPIAGAVVYWQESPQDGTNAGLDGQFSIPRKGKNLIVSLISYVNDTIFVADGQDNLEIVLHEDVQQLDDVVVEQRRLSQMRLRGSVTNDNVITQDELLRFACCDLGESFTSNPSIDVSYSDAATGVRQIKLLGLSGKYVQMLTESIPNYRGAAAPYALGYVPGPWLQSIQVSEGNASVKNGYEAMTGQINMEFKKPQDESSVHVNAYGNTEQKYEFNLDANAHLSKRWSTGILAHYENLSKEHDDNGDGFMDMPRQKQVHLQNRWNWHGDRYEFQASVQALKEERHGGQTAHTHGMLMPRGVPLYQITVETERYEAFAKNAYLLNAERQLNVALILSGSYHSQDAAYGYKSFDVDQKNLYASLLFETELNQRNKLSTGISLNHDNYHQQYNLLNRAGESLIGSNENETTPGAYVQYTYHVEDKFILMGGVRADHSNRYGSFVTPRLHVKYMPSEVFAIRASVGKGYRSNHVLAENNYLLASGRRVIVDANLTQEEAMNYGVSTALNIPLFGKNLNLNAAYYYTDFSHQTVVDMDSDPHAVYFRNLEGDSYSHTLQVEANYPLFKGMTFSVAYRLTDVKETYGSQLMQKPLTSRTKGLFSASYKTPLGIWQCDANLQLNGSGRMPTPYQAAGKRSWDEKYGSFEQLSAQVTRFFRHWSIYAGGENITGKRQRNPIIAASDPWGDDFDSTLIWGPLHGAIYYIGLRFNFE